MAFLCLDFDGTIARFDPVHGTITDIVMRFGVPQDTFYAAYNATKKNGGFSPEKLLDVLERDYSLRLDRARVIADIDAWLRASLTLYPDAARFLRPRTSTTLPFDIVTFGDAGFQHRKISLLNLAPRRVHVTSEPHTKATPLRALVAEHGTPILYIDDNGAELDAIRRAGLTEQEVITYHLVRDGITPPKTAFKHAKISSLKELNF